MKCPTCITNDLVKTKREGFELDYCPVCQGIWLERTQQDKIITKLIQSDLSHQNTQAVEEKKSNPEEKEKHHSPIMDSIEQSRELHQLHQNGGKHHWMHRLFK